jgi:hypothetical protein
LFYKKRTVAFKTCPEGTFIQLFAELSNGNLTGTENGNHGNKVSLPLASHPIKVNFGLA